VADRKGFTYRGRHFGYWASASSGSTTPPGIAPARAASPHWFAEVDGREYRLFEVSGNDLGNRTRRVRLARRIVNAVREQEPAADR